MSKNDPVHIAVVGSWHLGAVAAACLADLGFDVLGADPSEATVEGLQAGKAALFEPGLDELLQSGLASGRLSFTADVGAAVVGRPFVFIMFDTPVDENDQSDLTPIFDAVRTVAPSLEEGVVLLVTAQVPVGTCDQLAELVRELRPGLRFGIAYTPENLRLGSAIDLYRQPALPVLGSDDEPTLDALTELFSPLKVEWRRTTLRTAEMVKHGLNAFLATSICFGNELGNLCDEVGADGEQLAKLLRLEPRIGAKAMLLPGLGFSGGTIARDVQTLRGLGSRHEVPTRLLDGVWEANQLQNGIVVRKLRKHFGSLKGRRIGVLGLTYKPGTSTLRRSAALEIIADLVADGAEVSAYDPKADREEVAQLTGFTFVNDAYGALDGCDAAVVVTSWPEFRELDFPQVKESLAQPVLVDPNNFLDADSMLNLGFIYMDTGRGRGH